MVMCACKFIGFFCLLWSPIFADERFYRETETERRWNTPPRLTPEQTNGKSNHDNGSIQPRFLPFSASFTLSSAGLANNAHSLSVGGGNDGISFSQSTSQSGASNGNKGPGISASQSSSFSAGLSGISGADSNSFSLNHPAFGGNSQANSNSFALGQATSAAHGNVVNSQATSGAQSGVGTSHSSASSGASTSNVLPNSKVPNFRPVRPTWTNVAPNHQVGGVYNTNDGRKKLQVTQGNRGWTQRLPARGPIRLGVSLNDNGHQRRPEVFISEQRPFGYRGHRQGYTDTQKNWSFNGDTSTVRNEETWTQNPLTGPNPGMWSQSNGQNDKPNLQISGVSASSSASSNTPGGTAHGHSTSQSNFGPNGPTSWTNNRVQTTGNAQAQAQAGAAAIGQDYHGNTQGSFGSSAIAGSSQGNGNSWGNASSGNRGQNSQGQVIGEATGQASVQGTANAGSVSNVKFPENSRNSQKRKSRTRDPVGDILTDISDTVADIFDI